MSNPPANQEVLVTCLIGTSEHPQEIVAFWTKNGWRACAGEDIKKVDGWREFMDNPMAYFAPDQDWFPPTLPVGEDYGFPVDPDYAYRLLDNPLASFADDTDYFIEAMKALPR